LWSLTILLLVVFRIARKRALGRKDPLVQQPMVQQPAFQWQTTPNFTTQVHHELLSQQIDTVFNALTALIEAERIKLKSLTSGALNGNEPIAEPSPTMAEPPPQKHQPPPEQQQDMGVTVEQFSRQGLSREQIASHLGMSQSEVALASRMLAKQSVRQSARLNAVA
jgi:hypothetical protein